MSRWCAISRVISLTIPSHQERRRLSGQPGWCQRSAAFQCAINNRDGGRRTRRPSRGVHFGVTRPRHVAWHASRPWRCGPRLSLSFSLSSLVLALSASTAPTDRPTDQPITIVPCPRTSSNLVSLIIGRHRTLVVKPRRAFPHTRDAGITRRAICNWHGFQGREVHRSRLIRAELHGSVLEIDLHSAEKRKNARTRPVCTETGIQTLDLRREYSRISFGYISCKMNLS